MSLVCHKKSYLVCVKLTNFWIFMQPIPIFFQSTKLRQPKQGRDSCLKKTLHYILKIFNFITYRIVASRSTSRLVTCLGLFRLLMKGIFGPYVLWPLDKKLIFWIVTRVSTRDYTVFQNYILMTSFCASYESNLSW